MDITKKRIVVTGGAGFLGQHVVARLRQMGCRHLTVPRSAQYDLSTETDIVRLIKDAKPEIVVHLAALVGGIGANRHNPGSFLYKNLIMGTQLIEQSRQHGVEKFLMAGTICAYPKHTPVPFKESALWDGYPEETNAPYGLAKKILITQLQAYKQQYGFEGNNVLIVNLFGPGDNFDLDTSHVIPALIRKCIEARNRNDKAVKVWGTGKPTREFLYVEDAARAVGLAIEKLDTPDPVNIGTGVETPIAELVHTIAKLTRFKGAIEFEPNQPDGQPRRCLDVTRAKELLGFTAETTLEQGLAKTIAWFEGQQSKKLAA